MDPIEELVSDLCAHGKPSMAWVMRWQVDGMDPVQAAWNASEDAHSMLRFAWPLVPIMRAGAGHLAVKEMSLVKLPPVSTHQLPTYMNDDVITLRFHVEKDRQVYRMDFSTPSHRLTAEVAERARREAEKKLLDSVMKKELAAAVRKHIPIVPTIEELFATSWCR